MSFILDALRKSEHARQRQTGPGLAEVQVAPTKPKSNVWATAAVALLVVNLLAVGILLLRRAQKDDPAAAPTAATVTATAAGPAAGAASGPANPTLGMPPPTAGTPVTQGTAPVRAPIDEPAGPGGRNPLADEVGTASDAMQASARAAAAAVPAGPPAVEKNGPNRRGGSVVYAPVPEATELPYSPPPAPPAVQRSTPPAAVMPNADEVAARGGVAALHLDLHVYATQPQQRFIFVNSRKYKEGDTLAEGPVVEQITPDGAVLNFQGSQFRLSND
jgi:general secretion pathway protein B